MYNLLMVVWVFLHGAQVALAAAAEGAASRSLKPMRWGALALSAGSSLPPAATLLVLLRVFLVGGGGFSAERLAEGTAAPWRFWSHLGLLLFYLNAAAVVGTATALALPPRSRPHTWSLLSRACAFGAALLALYMCGRLIPSDRRPF